MNKRSSKSKQPGNRNGSVVRLASKPKQAVDVAAMWRAEGLDLERVTQELGQLAEVNATRVVKLHHSLSAGDYKIDAARVARKLIDFESRLTD